MSRKWSNKAEIENVNTRSRSIVFPPLWVGYWTNVKPNVSVINRKSWIIHMNVVNECYYPMSYLLQYNHMDVNLEVIQQVDIEQTSYTYQEAHRALSRLCMKTKSNLGGSSPRTPIGQIRQLRLETRANQFLLYCSLSRLT